MMSSNLVANLFRYFACICAQTVYILIRFIYFIHLQINFFSSATTCELCKKHVRKLSAQVFKLVIAVVYCCIAAVGE